MVDDLQLLQWVSRSLKRRMLLSVAGAIGGFLAALVVLWLSWWAIYFIAWFVLLTFEPPAVTILAITWVAFALLFVAYFTANRSQLEHLEFESPAKLRAARAAAYLTDSPFLALTGPKTAASFVRVVAAITLVGPGMLATAWKLLMQANAARKGPPDLIAAVLSTLAHAGVRVSLDDLFRIENSNRWDAAFQAVRLFDGVIVRSSEPVGLVLSDGLRNEVLKIAPTELRRLSAANSAPDRVSSPRASGGTPTSQLKRPASGTVAPAPKRPPTGTSVPEPKRIPKGTPPTDPKRKPRP